MEIVFIYEVYFENEIVLTLYNIILSILMMNMKEKEMIIVKKKKKGNKNA